MSNEAGFLISFRGYDVTAVDALVRQAVAALAGTDLAQRAAARDAVLHTRLHTTLRGYDRAQVEAHLNRLAKALS